MTTPEKWAWHTDVYAFRAVYLGIVEDRSPCDVDGKWYDKRAVGLAIDKKRRELNERLAKRRQHREREHREMQLEGRDHVNKWAQARGFDDLDAYCEARREDWSAAYVRIIGEILKAGVATASLGGEGGERSLLERSEREIARRRHEAKVEAEWEDPDYVRQRQAEAP